MTQINNRRRLLSFPSYVTRLEENAAPGTVLSFTDPYTPRVMDDDAGKNGVFSLTLIGNNGTFEISPNVAEGHANFVIRVRDNVMLDYEAAEYVHFQVKNLLFGYNFDLKIDKLTALPGSNLI